MKLITSTDIQTRQFASDLALKFKNRGGIITLSGELGAGKTTFVQGFAQGLGIEEKVLSPTFILMRQHNIPKTEKVLYHIDLYRLEGKNDPEALGLDEIISDKRSIVLIEWPERLKGKNLPDPVVVKIKKLPEGTREIEIDNLPD